MAFGSEQWMYNAGGFYPHEIDQSLRFDGVSSYLTRTPASDGNRKTWTWSGWVKRSAIGASQAFFGGAGGYPSTSAYFLGDDKIRFFSHTEATSAGIELDFTTAAVFRDVSSWYHVVFQYDTTATVTSDRAKLYVNGVLASITGTTGVDANPVYPALNFQAAWNSAGFLQRIGSHSGVWYLDGYLAEVNFVDGQALDPTDFGETKSGVWIPKRYSGTYGTNGFHLDFGNSGSLGADVSGNGNNWTPTNLATTDQMLDSPTNNFATLNPLFPDVGTCSEGNLKFTPGPSWSLMQSSFGITSGKWYMEATAASTPYVTVGITRGSGRGTIAYVGYDNNGNVYGFGYDVGGAILGDTGTGTVTSNTLATVTSYSLGDVIGIAFDADNGTLKFYLNNTLLYTETGIDPHEWIFSTSGYDGRASTMNFGQDSSFAGNKTRQGNTDANGIGDFYYAPPADYLALCSANLPETAIDPAEDDIPADYFNPVLYTGNSSTQSITGVGFQPDFVWLKSRTNASSHRLSDAVRGVNKQLMSNSTEAEAAYTTMLTSFDSDGFTLGDNVGINGSGYTNVAWNWKAGGAAVANTDGTIASQVSANTKAGFSIVTYTGNATAGATVGHGLSAAPEMVIYKRRDSVANWIIKSSLFDVDEYLTFTADQKYSAGGVFWNSTLPTSTVFSLGTSLSVNGSSADYVAYCFHSVEGFSKFGSYTGNGSADGPFIYTGFRPAYVMVKRTDTTEQWHVQDTKRSPKNVATETLYANLSNAEGTNVAQSVDYLSNGFKPRTNNSGYNASSGTYLYMAFAEMPFKYANAR